MPPKEKEQEMHEVLKSNDTVIHRMEKDRKEREK